MKKFWLIVLLLSGSAGFGQSTVDCECTPAGNSTACQPGSFCYLPVCDWKNGWGDFCMADWKSCDQTKQTCTCKGNMTMGTHTRKREGGEVK